MDDAHDAETEPTPYMRIPWPLVAVALLGILAVVLAAGLLANRYLRPQVGLVPTPLAAAAPPPAIATQSWRLYTPPPGLIQQPFPRWNSNQQPPPRHASQPSPPPHLPANPLQ